jgi:RHS repeat-associated protein
MKLAKLWMLSIVIFVLSSMLFAQTPLNLENGFKPYGSYEGSNMDTVNLLNGNLMMHIPVYPTAPQRGGKIDLSYILYSSTARWTTNCIPFCTWKPLAAGYSFQLPWDITARRTVSIDSTSGQTTYTAAGYLVVTGDGATHALYAVPGSADSSGQYTQYRTIDGTDYMLRLSNPDATSGLLNNAMVTDRRGTQYVSAFQGGTCSGHPQPPFWGGGGHSGMIDNYPLENGQMCSEHTFLNQITDSNGNNVTAWQQTSTVPAYDTMGRISSPWGTATTSTADSSGCPTIYPFYAAVSMTYTDANGTSENLKFCYNNVSYATAFGVSNIAEASGSGPVLTALIRPDGSQWTFTYDNFLNPLTITLPTGGTINYEWDTHLFNGPVTTSMRLVKSRTLTDNLGHSYKWSYGWGTISNLSLTNVSTDPNGNDTAHVFSYLAGGGSEGYVETSTLYYQGAKAAGQMLKRVDTDYALATAISSHIANVFPTSIQTAVYPSGKVSLVTKAYDTGPGSGAPVFGNVVTEKEYDWGQGTPGALLRETDTTYQWQTNSAYLTAQLVDLSASVVVKDGSGCALAQTDYFYDESAPQAYDSSGTLLPAGSHIAAPAAVRGNPTSVTKRLFTGCNPGSYTVVTSRTNWYDTGEAQQSVDPLGHITTYSYDPAYMGAFITKTCSPSTNGGAVAHCVSGTYSIDTGLLKTFTNENATTPASGNTHGDSAHTITYGYDSLLRLTSAVMPPDPGNGGLNAQTSFNFSAPNAFPFNVQRTKSITASLTDSTTSFFDGLGRSYQSQHILPGGTATVDTTLDFAGHPSVVSNPYFSTSDPTYGTVSTLFDGLGRAYSVTKQDGSVSSVAYNVITGAHDAVIGANTVGDCTDTTDEAGKQRRACTDALGRLVQVVEPNPGANATDATGSVVINGNEQSSTQSGASGSAQVTISGFENAVQVCPRTCHTLYDIGNVSVTANGYNKTVPYQQGSTKSTVAAALRDAFHGDPSSPVDASCTDQPCTNPVITLTARALGVATDYALACSSTANDSTDFTPPSFSPGCPAALAGGRDTITTPDSGSVTITVNGTNYSTTYGGGDTGATIAQRLASGISAGTLANGSASGSTVTITTKTGGNSTNYSLAASYAWNNTGFTNPSFTTSTSGSVLTGGYDAGVLDNQPYVTLYQYDGLGNLLRVDQKGTAPNDSTQWRTRTFTYDSLSRLLTAKNPESGTITYSYDADGNLLQKTSPAPNQTGTATQTVSYCYDELHRVTGKGYGAQSCPLATPVVTYAYDSGTNAIGKLTSLTDQAGTASYTYDILGRLAAETRTIAGVSKTLGYAYNLNGSIKSIIYPSGRTATYAYDTAGQAVSVTDSSNGVSYASGVTYWPNGAEYQRHSPAVFFSTTLNKRLQVSQFYSDNGVVSSYFLNKIYNYNDGLNNGNVLSIANNKDTTRSQTFTYDALNRLTSAQNAGTNCAAMTVNGKTEYWGNSYGYDAWGNLLNKSITKCSAENFSVAALANNQLSGYGYDAAGNMTTDPTDNVTLNYDQENRITGAAGYIYTYDADGNRVKKSNGATGTLYWYMTPGVVAESDLAGNLKSEYIFFNGKRLVRVDQPSNVYHYYLSDALNSTSMVVSASGVIENESDYYPWGGELQYTNADSNHYKFTGKERDSETGLDYFGARYYGNAIGRFATTDPVSGTPLHIINPQRWNMYSYGMNNPLFYIDPDGRDAIAVNFLNETPGGHEAIIVVHADGSATYARFGPAGGGKPFGKGQVDVQTLKPVAFKADGLPTDASYQQLAAAVGKIEGQPANDVGFNYFKTSEADSILLQDWIKRIKEAADNGKAPDYDVARQNCTTFCVAGLIAGHAIKEDQPVNMIPNRLFMLFAPLATENYDNLNGRTPKEKVTHKFKPPCGEKGQPKC